MLTAQVEPYSEVIPELREIYPQHWAELALNKDRVPLDPMYEVYDEKDRRGELLLVTLREFGTLAGYFIGFVGPCLHYRTCLTCTMDIYFVRPEYRGRFAGRRLFRAVIAELKRRGVQRCYVGEKLHKESGRLFKAFGFQPIEVYYSKWLGD